MPGIFDQTEFTVRCEWGLRGLQELAPASDVVIVIDVLSFTTAVDVAVARGAVVFPYPLKGPASEEYARERAAEMAQSFRDRGVSLSPASLESIPAGSRIVMPSPNGSKVSFGARHPLVFAACLRNATAVATRTANLGRSIAVIPAGETWDTGELRPSLEDWICAGAIIAALQGTRSPEAELAVAGFERYRDDLPTALRACSSGKELIVRGFARDVELAAQYDVSQCVPQLRGEYFTSSLG